MSGKITTFFSKGADTKREREDDAQGPVESMADEAAASPSKRPRRTRAAADSKTAEVEARAEENRKKALAKLAAKADKLPAVAAAAAAAAAAPPPPATTAASSGESLERRTMDPSWYAKLSGEFSKPYFKELQAFLASERASGAVIYPPEEEVYSWSRYCPLDQVRVVILGQDPYINERQAHGLAFSVNAGVPPPPSLVNMYKELATDIPGFEVPKHGSLVSWAKQGVLLLNAALTVRAGKSNSHAGHGWEKLTDAAIKLLNDSREHLVFLLWGGYAQKKGKAIDKKRHCVIACAHPSPLSAHNGFYGSKCFSRANDYLSQTGQTPIDWSSVCKGP